MEGGHKKKVRRKLWDEVNRLNAHYTGRGGGGAPVINSPLLPPLRAHIYVYDTAIIPAIAKM